MAYNETKWNILKRDGKELNGMEYKLKWYGIKWVGMKLNNGIEPSRKTAHSEMKQT